VADPGVLELIERRVLLLDGGTGSQYIAMGLEQGRAPEWWNLEHPDRVTAVHRGYVEAGSDIIQTNTFGGNPPKLESVGLGGRCREVNTRAAGHARAAAGPGTLVAGDVGPTGQLFPPMGDATEQQLEQAFTEQVQALAAGGVDLISIETMFDLREALAAVRAARSTGLPIFASMTFDAKKRGFFTMVGDRIGPSLNALAEAGAHVVGLNCTVGSEQMLAMVREARQEVERPLVAQPNAGQPHATPDGVVYDAEPEPFARDLIRIVEAGARVVGGCCGSNPDFIRAARAALDAR
jgi:5-methyltetrahydrofolate--homocysteine methyltransferase